MPNIVDIINDFVRQKKEEGVSLGQIIKILEVDDATFWRYRKGITRIPEDVISKMKERLGFTGMSNADRKEGKINSTEEREMDKKFLNSLAKLIQDRIAEIDTEESPSMQNGQRPET